MRKVGIIVIVALLAVSGIMAALAYNQATVITTGQMKVVNTNQALLTIRPHGGVGNLDETAYIEDGMLFFEFGKGRLGVFRGLQRNSIYEWAELVNVYNQSNEKLQLYVKVEGIPDHVQFDVAWTQGGWQTLWVEDVQDGQEVPMWVHTASNTTHRFGFRIHIGEEAEFAIDDLTVTVRAEAIP